MEPVLRSKYSKRRLATEIVGCFPQGTRRYVEALTTDAAIALTQPRSAKLTLLNFTDPTLQGFYDTVTNNPEAVLAAAESLWDDTDREEVQSLQIADPPDDPAAAAALTLYLNQLTHPGTGRYDKPRPLPAAALQACADRLTGVRTTLLDPTQVILEARPTDLVFVDTHQGLDPHTAWAAAQDSEAHVIVLASAADGLPGEQLATHRPGAKDRDLLAISPAH